jgi:hypothetical protein
VTDQLTLDYTPSEKAYRAQAEQFIAAEPAFWQLVVDEVHAAYRAGRHIGIAAIVEWARYEMVRRDLTGGKPYRINNNWRSAFSRILIEKYPYLEGTVETRRAPAVER